MLSSLQDVPITQQLLHEHWHQNGHLTVLPLQVFSRLAVKECYVCRTYLAKQLLPHDQRHWKAAGILLYARGQDGTLQLLLGRIDMGTKPAGPAKAWRRHEGWWILGE